MVTLLIWESNQKITSCCQVNTLFELLFLLCACGMEAANDFVLNETTLNHVLFPIMPIKA